MTHTGRMTFPIRPGTARRLGLKPPRPRGLIEIAVDMPQADLDDFAARFFRNAAADVGHYVLTLDNRKPAPRRRWWQRRNR